MPYNEVILHNKVDILYNKMIILHNNFHIHLNKDLILLNHILHMMED